MLQMVFYEAIKIRDSGLAPDATLSGQWPLLSFWRRSCVSWPSSPSKRPLQGPGSQLRQAETINQLASSWMNFPTKYPMYLVLIELSEQMRLRNMIFSIAWRPRDENEEADALTNEVFTGFDPGLRVPLQWDKLEFLVLPHLTELAEAHFQGAPRIKGERQKSVPRGGGCKSPAEEKTAQRN